VKARRGGAARRNPGGVFGLAAPPYAPALRIRSEAWIVTSILVVAFTLFYVFIGIPSGEKDRAEQDAAARASDDFLHALGRGDGRTACALLTKPAAITLATQQGEADCPTAVAALAHPLTTRERADIAAPS